MIRMYDAIRLRVHDEALVKSALEAVLDSGRYILGPQVQKFESEFARWNGVRFAVGVATGTDAIELALRALHIGQGSRVITVANAGGYSTTAIRACGATAIYAEIEPDTLLIDPASLQNLLLQKPHALILTHLYGKLAHPEQIVALCREAGVPVVEDCAQAHGAAIDGRRAGSFGDLGCYSFYPTKNLGALGDGGAVVTQDEVLAERVRTLRQYGWSKKYVVHIDGGRNSRLDELQAAILLAKLPRLDSDNARRRVIAARYNEAIQNSEVQILKGRGGSDDVVHLYVVRCARRDALRAYLSRHGIESDVHYPVPDHLQPAWLATPNSSLPVTEAAANAVLSLPCNPTMHEEEVKRVIDACNSYA